MSARKLCSCFAMQIEKFIDLRRLSGGDYAAQSRLLGYFDRFLVKTGRSEVRITREITDHYQQSLVRLASRTQGNRFCVVRQFCAYLAKTDPLSYVPEPLCLRPSHGTHQPYIYNRAEVRALLALASKLPPLGSLRPDTYRTLLGLLYSTGIRIGEAFSLKLEDFHASDQRLYIAAGKFRKARWIALSASTCRALQRYVAKRLPIKPGASGAPLLLNERGRRLCHPTVHHTFKGLLKQAGIAEHNRTAPRIHDLRHTFAVHRLLAWYRDGQDVNARLPALATYLGHVNIGSTQVYLRPTAELLGEVNQRFHHHYLQNIKPHGEQS